MTVPTNDLVSRQPKVGTMNLQTSSQDEAATSLPPQTKQTN